MQRTTLAWCRQLHTPNPDLLYCPTQTCCTACPPNYSGADKIAEDYPYLVETGLLDVLLPKKQDLVLIKL